MDDVARSVALLPQDVAPTGPLPAPPGSSPPTGLLPHGWLPPVLAAAVCGLQLTFWEQATSATGEMIDLLVFAFVIRCLLEFRIAQRQFWLSCAACFLGAGMANNWPLIGFFPVFLIAVLRAKGGAFFDVRFLGRMALWGLAGLSLYLLLPALHSLSTQAHVDFWPALKANLQSQREMLGVWRRPALRVLAFGALFLLIIFFRLADVLRVFDHIFILTGGGPGTTTQLLSLYMYRIEFKFFDSGQAAALAVLVLVSISILYSLITRVLPLERE